jgi:hypothetical protein
MQFAPLCLRGSFALLISALSSCNPYDLTNSQATVAGIYIGIGYSDYTSDAFLTLGARDSLQAQAFSGGWPRKTIYDSSIEPRRFRFLSTNPAVASVDSLGRITTLSVGETHLTASVAGLTSPVIRLAVSPEAIALVAEPDTVSARVGETFGVSVKALDVLGRSVPDVIFNVGLDTTWWAVTSEPLEGDWKVHTPITLHFQAKLAGRVRLILTVQNQRAESRFQATVPVTVEPR